MPVADPTRYNYYVLERGPYWWRQRQVARSVLRYPTTLVPSGNAVGKSYLCAGIVHWFLDEHPNSLVITTAPTQVQLAEVLWREIGRTHANARLPGKLLKSPLKIDRGGGWQALGYSTTSTERLSGHHAPDLLAVIDESSGVAPEIVEAIDSLNPSRLLMIGNPLRPDGPFYERCMRAKEQPSDLVNLIQIPSLESPDIKLKRSPRGLADATWLAKAKNDYGEGSLWWTTHVKGEFPDAGEDTLISRLWLDRAENAEHTPRGHNRLAIDLGEGKGGDKSVLLVRDDNGVRHMESSANWGFSVVASKAAILCQRFNIAPHRVTYDAQGIGADFGNRLESVGLKGCQPYRGGLGGNKGFGNLRTAAAWRLRQRLDPGRRVTVGKVEIDQAPFAIPARFMTLLRPELQAIRWTHNEAGVVCLEPKEDLVERIRHSPDHADALIISYAFPDA